MPADSSVSILYQDKGSTVSPTWLINGKSRYAVHTIVQLNFIVVKRSKKQATTILALGICLTIWSCYHQWLNELPAHTLLLMFAGSLLLVCGATVDLLRSRPKFQVDVVLRDGAKVTLARKTKPQATALLEGLTKAVDRHRYSESRGPSRGRWLQQGVARSPVRKAGKKKKRTAASVISQSIAVAVRSWIARMYTKLIHKINPVEDIEPPGNEPDEQLLERAQRPSSEGPVTVMKHRRRWSEIRNVFGLLFKKKRDGA